MVSVGSDADAYEENNGLYDTGNGGCPRKRTKKAKARLCPRSSKTDSWGVFGSKKLRAVITFSFKGLTKLNAFYY